MVDIEDLNIAELEQLRDACSRRILEMRQTRGLALPDLLRLLEEVKVTLGNQGKEWHSLERWQWMDGEVRFWLNPSDQDNYRTGWFSIDSLIAWTQDRGPIIFADELDELDEDRDQEMWQEDDAVPILWRSVTHPDDTVTEHDTALLQSL